MGIDRIDSEELDVKVETKMVECERKPNFDDQESKETENSFDLQKLGKSQEKKRKDNKSTSRSKSKTRASKKPKERVHDKPDIS